MVEQEVNNTSRWDNTQSFSHRQLQSEHWNTGLVGFINGGLVVLISVLREAFTCTGATTFEDLNEQIKTLYFHFSIYFIRHKRDLILLRGLHLYKKTNVLWVWDIFCQMVPFFAHPWDYCWVKSWVDVYRKKKQPTWMWYVWSSFWTSCFVWIEAAILTK